MHITKTLHTKSILIAMEFFKNILGYNHLRLIWLTFWMSEWTPEWMNTAIRTMFNTLRCSQEVGIYRDND